MELEHREISEMLETAKVAARLAGQLAMEELGYIKVSVKKESELVTQADGKCQELIIQRIKEAYSDHGFIAEEGPEGNLLKIAPRGEPIWWIIDPIDGTTNFAHRLLCFTISIAAFYKGRPVVGVVFDPSTDSMFTAVKDDYTRFNDSRISASEEKLSPLSSVAIDSNFENGLPNWAQQLVQKTRFRNLGSTALHFAYVAKGALTAAIHNEVKLWDVAAGMLLAGQAGAVVSDKKGTPVLPLDPADYNGEELDIITTNKKANEDILNLLQP